MKPMVVIIFIFFVAGLIFALSSKNDTSNTNEASIERQPVGNLDEVIKEVMRKVDNENVFLLDVRTDAEWNTLHASPAIHFGLEERLKKGELPNIDKDKEIYIYCRSGNRVEQAIEILERAGYTNLVNIKGLDDWVRNGGATEEGS